MMNSSVASGSVIIARATIFLSGLLFGLGLTISGMINPAKVIGFLDITGSWDPSLALVMGGALAVSLPAFQLILKREHPLFELKFYLPQKLILFLKHWLNKDLHLLYFHWIFLQKEIRMMKESPTREI